MVSEVGKIQIENVGKTFENSDGSKVVALSNVNLTIEAGSFVSLIGPSGCGKSTLLRAIAGLNLADEGAIYLDDNIIDKPSAERGFVFQQPTLFQWLNVRNNIAFGLKARGVYKEKKHEVDDILKLMGLEEFAKSYPHQLSGGMSQRASLARALVSHPKIMLLDEPLGALDAFTRMNMQNEILNMWEKHKMTIIMVTHDVDEAIYLSDKIVVMTPRPAKVEQIIEIPLFRPRERSQDVFLKYRTQILQLLHYASEVKEPEYYL